MGNFSSIEEILWDFTVSRLEREGSLRTPHIIEAFRVSLRSYFVDGDAEEICRTDNSFEIQCCQYNTQPKLAARFTELLKPTEEEHILEIGTGSGWHTAVLRECVGVRGRIRTMERFGDLVDHARERLEQLGYTNIEIERADGNDPQHMPNEKFDGILTTAGLPIAPLHLLRLLKLNGRMVYPKKMKEDDDRCNHRLAKIVRVAEDEFLEYESVFTSSSEPMQRGLV